MRFPQVHPTLGYTPYTSTHLHGSASLPEYDGYASDVTQPGQWKNYHYPNIQDARTLWYHDHGVGITAQNAYFGLAAQYHLHDDLERSLGLPGGAYDVPLILRDAMFAADGSLIFDDRNHSGLFGDVILVNGKPWPAMRVERRKYRFRMLNASVSRSFRLRLSTGEPFTMIASDGGLAPVPQQVADFRFGMAERYEMVIDFSKYAHRPARRAAEPAAQEQHRIRQHRQGHGVRRGRRALDARRQLHPRPAQPEHGGAWA